MSLLFYNILYTLGVLFLAPLILLMALARKKRRATFFRRLGFQDLSRKKPGAKKAVWVHALSVGEMYAAVPLVRGLLEKGETVALSATTLTGFETGRQALGDAVELLFYAPHDFFPSVLSVMSRIDPKALIIVESDVWPNTVTLAGQRGVPVILANGRLSDASFKGYKRFESLMGPVFRSFSAIAAQTERQRQRFLALGVKIDRLRITGNLKADRLPGPAREGAEAVREKMREELGLDPEARVLVAGSTHEGEEEAFLLHLAGWRATDPSLVLVIAPRDPGRAPGIRRLFEEKGFEAVLLSGCGNGRAKGVIVVDSMGVLARLYALGDICFVGGSLVREGGHNPLEPALWSRPVVFGPDMGDFPEITRDMVEAGGAVQIRDAEALGRTVAGLFTDPSRMKKMGERAEKVVKNNQGAVGRTLGLVREVLDNASC